MLRSMEATVGMLGRVVRLSGRTLDGIGKTLEGSLGYTEHCKLLFFLLSIQYTILFYQRFPSNGTHFYI